MSRPRKRSAAISDFFLATKVGITIFTATTMLFVGIIPAILISMAP